jgi:hypothetical protein
VAFDFDFKNFRANFFRPELILAKADRARRRALSKAGAFVRQRAKTSIRKAPMADAETGAILRGRRKKGRAMRPAISKPGDPPYSHEGSLKRLIFFAYDERRDSVVIGPAVFKNGEAPRLLEHGGAARRRGADGNLRTVHYRPRPYMAPALRAELPKFRELLRGMIN